MEPPPRKKRMMSFMLRANAAVLVVIAAIAAFRAAWVGVLVMLGVAVLVADGRTGAAPMGHLTRHA